MLSFFMLISCGSEFDILLEKQSSDSTSNTAPTATSYTITATPAGGSGKIKLSWTEATDAETPQTGLLYMAYYSTAIADVETYANAVSNGAGIYTLSWILFNDPFIGDPLTIGTLYWFNVFVKDTSGNITPYTPVSATPEL